VFAHILKGCAGGMLILISFGAYPKVLLPHAITPDVILIAPYLYVYSPVSR